MVNRLKNRGVDVLSGDRHFLPSFPKPNLLRLSIIRTDEQQIDEGIRIISEELERALLTS